MCRIAGIIHPDHSPAALAQITETMCGLQRHGGPDDGGIFSQPSDHLSLGNRRLSLLDLSAGGHQPMQYEHNRYTITYNGELYNYQSLKAELQSAGMHFSNHTDTEVILAAFARWNTQAFSRLNGMFAFAIWDDVDKIIYLVRDTAGIKPLYYSTHTGGVTFASEIRAFAPVPFLQEAQADAAVYQLAYGYVPEPVTTLQHVKPLPKGCFLQYDSRKKTSSLQSFSFYSFSSSITDRAAAVAVTKESLRDSIQRQLVADARVGVFLSGGLDSAVIADLANEARDKELHTISIHFNEEQYSEKKFQDLLADRMQSRHHSVLLTEKDFHENFPAFLRALDMPSCDGINTWFISKYAASEGLKAVLSGIGADELYGGYPSFARMQAAMWLQRRPDMLLRTAENTHFKKFSRTCYLQIPGTRGLYLFLRGHFTPTQIAAQLGAYENEIWTILKTTPASMPADNTGAGNTACLLEFSMYMQDQLLRDADVMSMAHGLEIRVPFLDDAVIRPVFAMSEKIKFTAQPKQLLTDAFGDSLPAEIWQRKKMGFSLPFAEWLRNSEYVTSLADSSNAHTRKAIADFMAGKLHWSRVMSLVVLGDGRW